MPSTPLLGQQPVPNAGHVIDVTEASFEHDVLDVSFERPVLIDFWAPWCQPCKQLSPVLEALAEEAGGQWRLAKIDVDKAPRLAQYFKAQSIPMVVAIFQGQLLSQFQGALSKREVERWLAEVFKRAGIELVKLVEPEVPSDPDQAIAFHRQRLAQRPDDTKTKLALGRLMFAKGDVTGADKILNEIPFSSPEFVAARAALNLKELIAEIGLAGGEEAIRTRLAATPDDVDATYLGALIDGTAGRFAAGLGVLVGQVGLAASRITPEQKTRAKKAAAMLFEAAGRNDPEVESERKRLTRLLF